MAPRLTHKTVPKLSAFKMTPSQNESPAVAFGASQFLIAPLRGPNRLARHHLRAGIVLVE
jgi:hypothetical protein